VCDLIAEAATASIRMQPPGGIMRVARKLRRCRLQSRLDALRIAARIDLCAADLPRSHTSQHGIQHRKEIGCTAWWPQLETVGTIEAVNDDFDRRIPA
jgi:hypothetical protein